MRESFIRVLNSKLDPFKLVDIQGGGQGNLHKWEFKEPNLLDDNALSVQGGTNNLSKDMKDEQYQYEDIKDGYFTVSAISNAIGMGKEEKTISRILLELRKIHDKKIE